jgi:hypothetical protein
MKKAPDFLGKRVTLLLPALLFVAVEVSAQKCDPCFVCPCNKTFYADPQTCVKNCDVTLRCFVGICRFCKKCEFYEDAKNQLLDEMIFLRAYADQQLADAANQKGLDGFLYDEAVSNMATIIRNNPSGWNWGNASAEDIENLFRSLPPTSPGQRTPSVAHSTNMGTCQIDINKNAFCVLADAARAHEQVHRNYCLNLNKCIQDFNNPLGPVSCKNPNQYTDWSRSIQNYRKDEIEAYCAGNRILLNWLLKNSGCENTPQGKQQLNDQQALLNSLCK